MRLRNFDIDNKNSLSWCGIWCFSFVWAKWDRYWKTKFWSICLHCHTTPAPPPPCTLPIPSMQINVPAQKYAQILRLVHRGHHKGSNKTLQLVSRHLSRYRYVDMWGSVFDPYPGADPILVYHVYYVSHPQSLTPPTHQHNLATAHLR